jgi:hypothetical protein
VSVCVGFHWWWKGEEQWKNSENNSADLEHFLYDNSTDRKTFSVVNACD